MVESAPRLDRLHEMLSKRVYGAEDEKELEVMEGEGVGCSGQQDGYTFQELLAAVQVSPSSGSLTK